MKFNHNEIFCKIFLVTKILIFTDAQKIKNKSNTSVQSQDEMPDSDSNNNNNKEISKCTCQLCPRHLINNKGMDNFY